MEIHRRPVLVFLRQAAALFRLSQSPPRRRHTPQEWTKSKIATRIS
jgi:hypothetical protein